MTNTLPAFAGLIRFACPSQKFISVDFIDILIETIYGDVVSVEKATPGRGMYYGIHLIVKTEEETLSVRLSPEWYMENQGITIMPGDKVEIKGHRISDRGEQAIIAAEVKRGDKTLKLRDESGLPFWRGRRVR